MTTGACDSILAVTPAPDTGSDDIDSLRAALAAEQLARREAEARASGAEAMVAHLKLVIAKLRHDQFGASSERGRKLIDQMELELEELEAASRRGCRYSSAAGCRRHERPCVHPSQACAGAIARTFAARAVVCFPAQPHAPAVAVALAKLGETITETLEVIPRQWKVVQTVREKFTCRACETITQPPAPFHPISRGRAGPNLLAMVLDAKFANHLPLNRQSEAYAREGIDLDVSTLADWVGACTATLAPLFTLIQAHVKAAERLHGDDTTVPVLAKGKTITGRLWTYVRDDRPFGGPAPPAAIFYYSRDRRGAASESASGWLSSASCRRTPMLASTISIRRHVNRPRRPKPVLGARAAQLLQAGRSGQGAACDRGGAADRRDLRRRAHHQRSADRTASCRATGAIGALVDDLETLDAQCARARCHATPMWRRQSTIC